MRSDERGSIAVTVALLLPLLLTTLVGVVQLGALRVIAAKIASAADLATLAATDDQDQNALVRTGTLRLAPDAVAVARTYFALNLASVAPLLPTTPESVAAQAQISAFAEVPAVDPLTGWRYEHPTVRIAVDVPVRTPVFGVVLPASLIVRVRSASAPR